MYKKMLFKMFLYATFAVRFIVDSLQYIQLKPLAIKQFENEGHYCLYNKIEADKCSMKYLYCNIKNL